MQLPFAGIIRALFVVCVLTLILRYTFDAVQTVYAAVYCGCVQPGAFGQDVGGASRGCHQRDVRVCIIELFAHHIHHDTSDSGLAGSGSTFEYKSLGVFVA